MTLTPPTCAGAPVHDSLRRSPDVNGRFVTDRDSLTVAQNGTRYAPFWAVFGIPLLRISARA